MASEDGYGRLRVPAEHGDRGSGLSPVHGDGRR